MGAPAAPKLTAAQRAALLATLQARFAEHPGRHAGITWAPVAARLDALQRAVMGRAPGAVAKLYEAGRPNELLHEIIRCNVRTPGHVFGDLAAQVSSGRVGTERWYRAVYERLVEIGFNGTILEELKSVSAELSHFGN